MNAEERHLVLLSYAIIGFFVSIGFTAVNADFLPWVGVATAWMLGTGFLPIFIFGDYRKVFGETPE
jgi:hypothetical protein